MMKPRSDSELPPATERWGWKYHHLGIPTDKARPGERYLPQYKFHVSGFDTSPYGVEWMRFDKDSPVHSLIQTIPHVAFQVEDLDAELARRDLHVIGEPGSPSEGVRTVMIEHNGAPVELIEFRRGK